jgi:NAD(P)-dependent dehydrogenase (short-subunit alcohol dehydrogenase family)
MLHIEHVSGEHLCESGAKQMEISTKVLRLLSLEGKVAVITGAASGIGRGTAELFAQMGSKVALLDIDQAKGGEVESSINKDGRCAKFFKCDVRSHADCKKATEDIIARFGKIDILFNNAGVAIRKNTVDLSEKEWDLALDVTLKGIFMLSHYVIPHMINNGGGSIINTGSGWSLKGGANAVSYCAAKGGTVNLTRAMAIDHGKHNIRVNCICPGDIDTPLLHGECEQLGENEEQFMKEAADRPINRVGTPQDVAHAALFFSSDMSVWVTGAHLVVDGGGLA